MDRLTRPDFTEGMHHDSSILVLGATGKTGRRVTARLEAAGHAVRAGSRSATPPFDWSDRATWPAVVDGAGAAYIAYVPDLAFPGAADDVAVAALTTSAHLGTVVEVTGPRLLSFADVVDEISATIGRDVRYVAVSPAAFTAAMTAAGLPPGEAADLTDLFTTVLDGRNASLTDGVERALGRPARDIREWASATAATGVWDARPLQETA